MQDNNEAGASPASRKALRQAWAAGPVEDALREQLIRAGSPPDVVPSGQVVELLREIGDLRRRLHSLYYALDES